MFTGIVQEIVTILATVTRDDCWQVTITQPSRCSYEIGDSILLNGICSTVISRSADSLTVEYMPQTRQHTTVNNWRPQQSLNCEAPLTFASKLSGSLVLGHIDTVATVQSFSAQQPADLTVSWQQTVPAAVVMHGSITLDGVNLTVANFTENTVTVAVIPQTLRQTTLSHLQIGQTVNVEYDYIAKVIAAQLATRWSHLAR